MKTIQKLLFLVLLYQATPYLSYSQAGIPVKSTEPNKPFIFATLPQKFECNGASLRNLFSKEINEEVSIQLTRNFSFKGVLTAKVQQDQNVLSVNILSSNFPGTLLNLSLIVQPDKSETMIGRILNPRSGDALLIEHDNNRYYITKDLQKFVMAECPLPQQDPSSL